VAVQFSDPAQGLKGSICSSDHPPSLFSSSSYQSSLYDTEDIISPPEFTNFQKGRIYTLTLENVVYNCVGIPCNNNEDFRFGIAEIAEPNDIVVNEVLFNPVGDGVDFVEIYNRSGKIIDLSTLKLGSISINQFEPNDTIYKSVSGENILLLMEEYLVLTIDPVIVMDQYFTNSPQSFLKMESLPSYNNESGTVLISGENGTLIDAFSYDEDMHHPLLYSVEGVSLERINFNRSSQDNTNWHSASEEVGYATPGYENSQFVEEGEIEEEVTIDPEIFSPDNDGYNDVVNIHYKFDQTGYTADITIFDAQGRLIKYLVENSLLGTSGTYTWDGRTEDNQKANIGIYIIYFEAFNPEGQVKKYKISVVLAGNI